MKGDKECAWCNILFKEAEKGPARQFSGQNWHLTAERLWVWTLGLWGGVATVGSLRYSDSSHSAKICKWIDNSKLLVWGKVQMVVGLFLKKNLALRWTDDLSKVKLCLCPNRQLWLTLLCKRERQKKINDFINEILNQLMLKLIHSWRIEDRKKKTFFFISREPNLHSSTSSALPCDQCYVGIRCCLNYQHNSCNQSFKAGWNHEQLISKSFDP